MRKYVTYVMGAVMLSFVASCSSDDNEKDYGGINQIYLSAENPVIDESESAPLVVNIDLTSACDEAVTLDFKVMDDAEGVLKLEGNPVTIPAGKRTASFRVLSSQLNILEEDTYFNIGLASDVDGMKLNDMLKVRVIPALEIPELTEAQKALIDGYKEKYGFDLNDWLGAVTCQTKVESPGDGATESFAAPFTKELKGKTVITLSESATADKPVLKMSYNPMGLTEYLAWVMRQETVENNDYWYGEYASPAYAQIMELLNWNKENPGTFTMSLDNLELSDMSSVAATIDFVEEEDEYKGFAIVPFDYVFSAWEKQKNLIEEGNQTAIDLEDTDGTANPSYYLQYASVLEDEMEDGNFMNPEGKLNFSDGKMTFQFVFSHNMAGGYTRIFVTYEKK